ncbi:uncharacterized protein LOC130441349 isoform X1 [Diorhabda sublineata]|uniref:uncharacterized protein LOC130441349 isoform X1 n=1 Tax=Diorhabda sublineata TaxID=1163346 RepID=UPI0024E045FB|nr:uncharacterized protein LOC130441349 isoform X1 [Diorhabda sublineata]
MAELQNPLPPGWDCRRDAATGKLYYINHYTKTTTWEDPRGKHRIIQNTQKHPNSAQNEYIPMQHGTPESRRNYVYPRQNSPIPAFQMPTHMTTKSLPLQDMKPKISPLTVRSSKVQDSSLNSADPEEATVAKIAGMFPTVPETHIKMLLKKYHSREALVISALQVEKYPITTPGPFATPPPQRNIHATPPLGFRVNSRCDSPGPTGSPAPGCFRSSPRPHSSPKLKLRYMKSIFPQADEMIILDILQNNDSNIQKTSEILKDMGYVRKDTVKIAQQKLEAKKEEERKEEQEIAAANVRPPIKNSEDKKKIKAALQDKYKDIAEHLICIALESVNFDEERANQIIQIMIQEDQTTNNKKDQDSVDALNQPSTSSAVDIPISQSRQSLKSLLKTEKELEKTSYSRLVEEESSVYKSPNLSNTRGPNPEYAKGANEKLLLEDYMKWQGPNSTLSTGSLGLAKGHNPNLLSNRGYKPMGPNRNLIKGPQCGLSKGSIFSQFKTAVFVGETRGD